MTGGLDFVALVSALLVFCIHAQYIGDRYPSKLFLTNGVPENKGHNSGRARTRGTINSRQLPLTRQVLSSSRTFDLRQQQLPPTGRSLQQNSFDQMRYKQGKQLLVQHYQKQQDPYQRFQDTTFASHHPRLFRQNSKFMTTQRRIQLNRLHQQDSVKNQHRYLQNLQQREQNNQQRGHFQQLQPRTVSNQRGQQFSYRSQIQHNKFQEMEFKNQEHQQRSHTSHILNRYPNNPHELEAAKNQDHHHRLQHLLSTTHSQNHEIPGSRANFQNYPTNTDGRSRFEISHENLLKPQHFSSSRDSIFTEEIARVLPQLVSSVPPDSGTVTMYGVNGNDVTLKTAKLVLSPSSNRSLSKQTLDQSSLVGTSVKDDLNLRTKFQKYKEIGQTSVPSMNPSNHLAALKTFSSSPVIGAQRSIIRSTIPVMSSGSQQSPDRVAVSINQGGQMSMVEQSRGGVLETKGVSVSALKENTTTQPTVSGMTNQMLQMFEALKLVINSLNNAGSSQLAMGGANQAMAGVGPLMGGASEMARMYQIGSPYSMMGSHMYNPMGIPEMPFMWDTESPDSPDPPPETASQLTKPPSVQLPVPQQQPVQTAQVQSLLSQTTTVQAPVPQSLQTPKQQIAVVQQPKLQISIEQMPVPQTASVQASTLQQQPTNLQTVAVQSPKLQTFILQTPIPQLQPLQIQQKNLQMPVQQQQAPPFLIKPERSLQTTLQQQQSLQTPAQLQQPIQTPVQEQQPLQTQTQQQQRLQTPVKQQKQEPLQTPVQQQQTLQLPALQTPALHQTAPAHSQKPQTKLTQESFAPQILPQPPLLSSQSQVLNRPLITQVSEQYPTLVARTAVEGLRKLPETTNSAQAASKLPVDLIKTATTTTRNDVASAGIAISGAAVSTLTPSSFNTTIAYLAQQIIKALKLVYGSGYSSFSDNSQGHSHITSTYNYTHVDTKIAENYGQSSASTPTSPTLPVSTINTTTIAPSSTITVAGEVEIEVEDYQTTTTTTVPAPQQLDTNWGTFELEGINGTVEGLLNNTSKETPTTTSPRTSTTTESTTTDEEMAEEAADMAAMNQDFGRTLSEADKALIRNYLSNSNTFLNYDYSG